jgi:hypothetical protein
MTYALRQPVLCDGLPGVICGKSFIDYNVLMVSGEFRKNVEADRLRPRPVAMRRVE